MFNHTAKLLSTAAAVSIVALAAGNAFAQQVVDDTARGKASANSHGIASVEDRVDDLQSQITTEVGNRTSADAGLQGQINTEISNRTSVDEGLQTQITTEATSRATADAGLQTQIDNIELTPGPQGEKGEKGDTGATGAQGTAGTDGAKGDQGDKGDKGETGEQGPTGPQGAQGQSAPASVIADLQAQIDELFSDLFNKTVFVTSTTHDGLLGGGKGADTICQNAAISAGLIGTYKAWLSTGEDGYTGTDARQRLIHSPRPYIRTDRVRVAGNWPDLTDGELANPINVDENGDLVNGPNFLVWTGTDASGDQTLPPFSIGDTIY